MSDPVRIFLDGNALDAEPGERAVDAIARANPGMAADLRSGARVLADSRGLPVPADTPVFAGAIFRTMSGRHAGHAAPPPRP